MNEMAVFTGIVLVLLLVALMGIPFWQRRQRRANVSLGESSAVLQERLDQIITTVNDLDFDYDTGKVAPEDYVEHRKLLVGRGVSTLIQLESSLAQETEWDDDVELLIQEYRQQKA